MFVPTSTVELTKIHFYDRNISIISREHYENEINRQIVIKKRFFAKKWILKINEIGGAPKKFQWRLLGGTVFIIITILISLLFFKYQKTRHETVLRVVPTPDNLVPKVICQNCSDICLKLTETGDPQCLQALDRKDPTGCGGFCTINVQFCQLLDTKHRIYQCLTLNNTLKCPFNHFNCGNMCIGGDKKCDGKIHCSNKSDEIDCDCDLMTHFRCGNLTSCLPKTKQCDGVVDCWDKSDEFNCNRCQNGTVPCITGCIPRENICDGEIQCPDQSDEPHWCTL